MTPSSPFPSPLPSPALAAPFTQGLAARVLRYQRCTSCGTAQTLARYACQHCGAPSLDWHEAQGTGRVQAVTVVGRAPSDSFRALVPYTLVLVQLDEGPRLMAHAQPGVQIGQRVQAGFFVHDQTTLVRFSPQPG
ncbi:MAG: OB-fold domain-containing protein [Burkholderiaceae bacterium]|nr:OB-fold domain-containing protein [Burkholderiaceae bacterium]